MQGNLAKDYLPQLLRGLDKDRESGILQVSRDDISKRIYFGRGSMVFARSTQHSDRLGEHLVREGVLTRANLALASNKMRERRELLGQTLVALGLLNQHQLARHLTKQVQSIIYSLFAWNRGEYQFRPQADAVDQKMTVDLPTVPIILEGTRRMDMDIVRAALGDTSRVATYTKDPRVIQHYANLSPEEGFVLSRIDGHASMDEIVSICPIDEKQTLRCLYGLVAGGFLEFGQKSRQVVASTRRKAAQPAAVSQPAAGASPTPEPSAVTAEERIVREAIEEKLASLAGATHYDVLEIPKNAKHAEVKKAFAEMIRKYHPDRHASSRLADVRQSLEQIINRVNDARAVLSDSTQRRHYDNSLRTEAPRGEINAPSVVPKPKEPPKPTSTQLMAERYYDQAKQYYARRDFHETVRLMEEAVGIDGSNARYHCLLAQAMAHNPKWRKSAEEHFKLALSADPFHSESLIGLAELYESVGLHRRAQALYAEAVEIDPGNAVLRVKLHSLN